MSKIVIRPDDLTGEAVRALIALHLGQMHVHTPACKVHALPLEALRQPGVTFYSAWVDGDLAGMGALKQLEPGHGELKSMRVAPAFLGQGVGKAILRHLLAEARGMGLMRVSLETGRSAPFVPALELYRAHGFVPCAAFADYVVDDVSQCLTLHL